MGVVASKSPLERRNSVLRRSQRKSIHKTKSRIDQLTKEIKKFKGTEVNADFSALKVKIETAERELLHFSKNLQPQVRQIYNDALKKAEDCHRLLSEKLKENQEKVPQTQTEPEGDDEVFVIEEVNEAKELEQTTEKRKTVELNLVRVEPIEESPQANKRLSIVKMGVPVMPGSMLEALHRKSEEAVHLGERVARIREEIGQLEVEISGFVGGRNGARYVQIKGKLEGFSEELRGVESEEVKLCRQYIGSCLSFLEEKAVQVGDVVDGVGKDGGLSPRSIRTTYI